ncbi:MAG: hypothetical protein ACL93V_07260 [Candidatus Electrothrix sp. YB6]
MEAYKFKTTVLRNGVIKLPEISQYAERQVEVFVVIKQAENTSQERSMEQFLEKWTGFLRGTVSDDLKLQYLKEKYK